MYFGYFPKRILDRGESYFKRNKVFSIQKKGEHHYSAIVLGTEAYHVSLALNEKGNIVQAFCDCPYAKDGNRCKHEAALYFALEGRLLNEKGISFQVKKVFQYCRRITYNDYSLHYQFNKELDKCFKQLDKLDNHEIKIKNFQKIIDDFVALKYPSSFRNKIIEKLFEKYRKIMKNDENDIQWLQLCLQDDRYRSCIYFLIEIIKSFEPDQQLMILKEALQKNADEDVLMIYIDLLKNMDHDIAEALKELPYCQNLGCYHYELIKDYLIHHESHLVQQQYQSFLNNHNACTPYYLSKIESLVCDDKKESFYQYVSHHCRYYDGHEVIACYKDLKDVYYDPQDLYPIKFLNQIKNTFDQEYYCYILYATDNLKMLMLELLENGQMNVLEQYQKKLCEFDKADFLLVFVHSLLEHMQFVKNSKDYQVAQKWFDELFQMIEDPLIKIEVAHLFVEKYPKRKKIREIVESYLDDRGTR